MKASKAREIQQDSEAFEQMKRGLHTLFLGIEQAARRGEMERVIVGLEKEHVTYFKSLGYSVKPMGDQDEASRHVVSWAENFGHDD